MPLNSAEKVVDTLCRRSFLSLWSYANPKGKNGKELCDVLVVCDPYVIIFSVKKIALGSSGDMSVDWSRWKRAAIDESVKQIHGAERWLKKARQIIATDGRLGVELPKDPVFHRVAVALGAKREVPMGSGDFGKGFIHVLDEVSLAVLLRELDTISDFATYLARKEDFLKAAKRVVVDGGGEEDLLAMYLYSGRAFPTNVNVAILTGGIWKAIAAKPEFKARRKDDGHSYVWDRLIERVASDAARGELKYGNLSSEYELVLRTMAKEDRFCRRILGKSLIHFMSEASEAKIDSRIVPSPSGIAYVFLALPIETKREFRASILDLRCFVARGLMDRSGVKTVVGIATERYRRAQGYSLDFIFLQKGQWEEEDQQVADGIQREFGYFASPRLGRVEMDEFPLARDEAPEAQHSRRDI